MERGAATRSANPSMKRAYASPGIADLQARIEPDSDRHSTSGSQLQQQTPAPLLGIEFAKCPWLPVVDRRADDTVCRPTYGSQSNWSIP